MRKVAEVIINVLTVIVFIFLAIIIFAKVKMLITNKDYFELFGYSAFNVATGSMEPTIKQNDIIIVKMNDKYEIDDIITFEKDNAYIKHKEEPLCRKINAKSVPIRIPVPVPT